MEGGGGEGKNKGVVVCFSFRGFQICFRAPTAPRIVIDRLRRSLWQREMMDGVGERT